MSGTGDYCDECGIRIGAVGPDDGEPPEVVAATAVAAALCPGCGAEATGRFCEVCGIDLAAAAAGPMPVPVPVPPPDDSGPVPVVWWLVVSADREYFDRMRAMDGPDAGDVDYPVFCPDRRFALDGGQLLIGRRSRTRGIYPDIDLIGPPEDAAVSHTHALLVAQPGGGWAVIDLRSTNHTYVDGSSDPIDAELPTPLADGTYVNVGAWTRLTLHTGPMPGP
ncbi:FHA domain-containing protein [Cryptosporangium sp. NPDC051539]|uniref:FHA domain-containing protein n=1 Tax=Cryptosporangium sp. NPDC051539 TaxID=3363962 RepID=UPI0037B38DCF